METSLYIIKPEGMLYLEQIRLLLQRRLKLGQRKTLILPRWAIDGFYPDLSADLQQATYRAFKGSVEVGLVHGERAIDTLLTLAGTRTAPNGCTPESIRYCFGMKEPIIVNGVAYYFNAIHRPKDLTEAEEHIRIFTQL